MKGKCLIGIVLFVAVLSGCNTVHSGDEVNVDFYGDATINGTNTEIIGEVQIEGGIPDKDTYDNITVYFLDDEKNIRYTSDAGSIADAPNSTSIRSSAPFIANYIVFNSPDFWDEKIEARYFELTDEGYVGHQASEEGELPGFG